MSLGAKPIFVDNVQGIEGEGAGGYASETSPEYQEAQARPGSSHLAKQDIVITTALIPRRPAPKGVERHGVKMVGHRNVAGRLPADASALSARNLLDVLSTFRDKKQGRTILDAEIGDAMRSTRNGAVVSTRLSA